jgi:phage-related minor tail protein
MSAWLDAVKEAFAKLRKTNPKATLAEAMKEAKKTYAPATPKAKKEKARSVSPMSKKS